MPDIQWQGYNHQLTAMVTSMANMRSPLGDAGNNDNAVAKIQARISLDMEKSDKPHVGKLDYATPKIESRDTARKKLRTFIGML